MNNPESLVYWSDESQLMGYGESDSSGCWLKFQIHPEDLDKFRGLKGTVFHLTMVKIQDNGEPEKQQKPYADKPIGRLCREALELSEDKVFQYFMSIKRPTIMDKLTPHFTAKAIKDYCEIETRKAIDYDKYANARWRKLINTYNDWRKENVGKGTF